MAKRINKPKNVTLPPGLTEWAVARAASREQTFSAYVAELIRREQDGLLSIQPTPAAPSRPRAKS